MAVDNAWVGVIGALGGVALTSLVGLGTASLTHRWTSRDRDEDRTYAREEAHRMTRRDAYVDYLVAVDAWTTVAYAAFLDSAWQQEHASLTGFERILAARRLEPAVFDAYQAAVRRVELLGGDKVTKQLHAYDDKVVANMVKTAKTGEAAAPKDIQERRDLDDLLIDAMKSDLAPLALSVAAVEGG